MLNVYIVIGVYDGESHHQARTSRIAAAQRDVSRARCAALSFNILEGSYKLFAQSLFDLPDVCVYVCVAF